jgi:hypothetical protein
VSAGERADLSEAIISSTTLRALAASRKPGSLSESEVVGSSSMYLANSGRTWRRRVVTALCERPVDLFFDERLEESSGVEVHGGPGRLQQGDRHGADGDRCGRAGKGWRRPAGENGAVRGRYVGVGPVAWGEWLRGRRREAGVGDRAMRGGRSRSKAEGRRRWFRRWI